MVTAYMRFEAFSQLLLSKYFHCVIPYNNIVVETRLICNSWNFLHTQSNPEPIWYLSDVLEMRV